MISQEELDKDRERVSREVQQLRNQIGALQKALPQIQAQLNGAVALENYLVGKKKACEGEPSQTEDDNSDKPET